MLGSTGRAPLGSHELLPAVYLPDVGPGRGSPEERLSSPCSTRLTGDLRTVVKHKSSSSSGNGQKELPDLSLLIFQWEKERAILFPHQRHKLLGSRCPPCTQHGPQTFPACHSSARGTVQLSEPHLALLHFAANSPFPFMSPGAYLG